MGSTSDVNGHALDDTMNKKKKNTDTRRRLIELGPEYLTDILLDLADRHRDAEAIVKRLTATPQENTKRFKTKLAGIKRRRRFLGRRSSFAFADELRSLLQDLRAGIHDYLMGVRLVAEFYKADDAIFRQCDDSFGNVGDIFRIDASNVFVSFAANCDDKEEIIDLVLELNSEDEYGVRDSLFQCASEYLPDRELRSMVDRLWDLSREETDEHRTLHWISGVESLARQMKDAPLYEKARLALWPELSAAACIDIAGIYLETGDAQTALTWLRRIPDREHFKVHEQDELLLTIYKTIGDQENMESVAWRIFRRDRTEHTLACLLDAIGEDLRDQVIEGEIQAILESQHLSYSDVTFLIEINHLAEAESYLLDRRELLDGDHYTGLLPLADHMEANSRWLTASVLYRALLDSILRRGRSKYYTHGVRYLKKLDALDPRIPDWRNIPSHIEYTQGLRKNHGRKTSFWSRYEK